MNMRDLDLNLLLVFEAIYSSGNISRAAENLDMSQPALSNALARLRKQMDDKLFVRSGNGVVPTSRAEEIIEPVRDALATLRRSFGPDSAFDPEVSRRSFRLLVADPLEQIIMPRILRSIGSQTQITFELQPPQSMQVEESLLSGKTDLAAFLMPGRNPELNSKPLCPVDLVVLTRTGHPRIAQSVTLPELAAEGFVTIALTPGKLANSEKVTFWQRLHVREVCQVYKISSVAQLVSQTDLIGIVPRIYAFQIASVYGLQIVDLPIALSNQQFHLIWHNRSDADDGHQWLRETMAAAISAKCDDMATEPAR